mgnify:CR=1 FL=1
MLRMNIKTPLKRFVMRERFFVHGSKEYSLQDIESSKKEAPYGKSRGASFLLK